jgi:hypothetical protein
VWMKKKEQSVLFFHPIFSNKRGQVKQSKWYTHIDFILAFASSFHNKQTLVVKSRGQHCGGIELAGYLANAADPVPSVMDLRIPHDRMGSSTDPSLNGHLKYPNNLDQSLNDEAADKIRKYRTDYNNRPPSAVSFIPAMASTSGRLHSEFVRLLFLQTHRETDRFFAASGVQLAPTHPGGQFTFLRAAFLTHLQSKVGLALSKAAPLRVNLNLDGAPIASKSHTHPSHSQTSRLLTSSLSLGVPVPRPTQCVSEMGFSIRSSTHHNHTYTFIVSSSAS